MSIEIEEKIPSLRRGSLKTIFYIVLLAILLFIVNFVFGWTTVEEIPSILQPFNSIILLINPYLVYIQGGLVFVFGYLAIKAISELVYTYIRRVSDHPTAATLRTITRISGIAVLVSMTASVFNVNPAAALTVGSFGGLVVGFATQTILSHVVAGVFLLISRPFTFGDVVTVAGQTGIVKEVKLMHLLLEAEDGKKEILIPSGKVVTQVIQKKRPPALVKPIKTVLTLDAPPTTTIRGSSVVFTGKLAEEHAGNPVVGVTVKMFESDIGGDDLLASGTTEEDGSFSIEWKATKTDWRDNTAEIYAKFEGNNDYRRSESKQYLMTIKRQEG